MYQWRIIAAAMTVSVLAACTPDAQEASHKGDRLVSAEEARRAPPTPWASVMLRFNDLKTIERTSERRDRDFLELQLTSITQALPITAGPTPREILAEAAQPDSLAARLAHKLGSRLSRVFAGPASFYSRGQRVASGDRFVPEGLTAAHRTLPFGTKLRVTDPKTGRSVVVTVNDRGPFIRGRVLDLSLGAARELGMTERGVVQVRAEVI